MEQNSVSFTLQEADVVAATRLAVTCRRPFYNKWLVPAGFVLGFVGVLLAGGNRESLLWVLAVATIVAATALLLLDHLYLPWLARRHFSELAAFKGATNFSWDAGGIQLVGPKGESRLDWSDYYRWAEDERLVLLFQSRILYNMVPKSALSQGQLDGIRSHLESAGVRKY